jgi:hypothetical protein
VFVFGCHRLTTSSALGTPLEWPEAKKVADQVRSWGIEVCDCIRRASGEADMRGSNSLLSGETRKGRRGMPFCGVMR